MIRTLVVDDQPLAVERLRTLLATQDDVEVVGTARSGQEAVAAVARLAPDLVFLDLQMPELDGFGVVAAIGANRMPLTIFVTAYDEHALRAFEVHALDYLLKPFGRTRLEQAVARARRQLEVERAGAMASRLLALVEDLRTPRTAGPRMLIRSGGRVVYVSIDQIDWVEAQGNYSVLHVGDQAYRVRATLTALAEQLASHGFARTHRSTLVNVDRIRELRFAPGGDYEVVLRDGKTLGLTRLYREALQARLRDGP
jgi:two-component system, LytTR family, response regulator